MLVYLNDNPKIKSCAMQFIKFQSRLEVGRRIARLSTLIALPPLLPLRLHYVSDTSLNLYRYDFTETVHSVHRGNFF